VPGAAVKGTVNSGETHTFQFTLEQDQIATITLSARDFRLLVRGVAPDGSSLPEVPHTRLGPLTMNVIATHGGRYQLSLSSLEPATLVAEYELKLSQPRPVTSHDRRSATAAAEFQRIELLRLKSPNPDFADVVQGYRKAANTWSREGQWTEATTAWQQLAEAYFERGDYKNALVAFTDALAASKRTTDEILTLTEQANTGYVQLYLGDLDRATAIFNECERTLQKLPVSEDSNRKLLTAQLQNNRGEVQYLRGDLKGSMQSFDRALAGLRSLGDRRGEALVHLNLGYSYLDSGRTTEATQEFDSALSGWRELSDQRGEARALTARGELFTLLGDRYAAADSHNTARALFRLIGDRQGEAVTSNGLAKVFEDLNRKQEALDNYSLAMRLNHDIGNRDSEAVGAYYVGRVSRDLGDLPRALDYLNESLALCRKLGKKRIEALVSMDLAPILIKQQKLNEAEKVYQSTLRYYESISDIRRQAFAHQGLGEIHRVRGQGAAAIDEYLLSFSLLQRINDPQGQAESLFWLASISQQQGQLKEALDYSTKAIGLIEYQRARLVGESWRSSYFASVRRHFELYVDILMQLHREQPDKGFAAKAFEASEQARARSLLETLAESQSEIRLGVSQDLLQRERQLRQQLSAKAAYQLKMLNTGQHDAVGAQVEAELRQLNNDYDFVQTQIKAQSPAFHRLIQPATLTLAQVQASLREEPDNTVLLEYLLGDDRSYVWLVTANDVIARELPGRRTLEDMALEVYRGLTARRKQPDEGFAEYHERYPVAEERFCPTAARLSQTLLSILPATQEPRRLLIAADGTLQYIPFDALPLPNADGSLPPCRLDAKDSYLPLLTKFEIVNLPSFSSLMILRQMKLSMPTQARGIAVWADPVFERDDPRVSSELPKTSQNADEDRPFDPSYLPPARLLATEEEAQSIMRFAPAGLSVLLTGFSANRESTIDRDWYNYRILHFATHSLVNTRYPALSGILLSTMDEHGRARNGLLQLHDIYSLRLNADLVVLSGCQSGLGEKLSGEGLVGLTQGFLYAGAKSVVVSLWPVEDKTTATLMTNFYHAMFQDKLPPAQALRDAKLKMLQTDPSRVPYYWSAFVIQGEYRTSAVSWRNRLQSRLIWAGAAFICIAAWLSYSWLSRRKAAHAQVTS